GRDRDGPAAERRRQAGQPVEIGGARQRVHEPAVGGPHLDEPELGDVARDGRLHGVDPHLAERIRHLRLRRQRPLPHELEDRSLPLEALHRPSTSRRTARPCSSSSGLTVRGGVRRTVSAPAVQTSRPRENAASTTSAAGRPTSRASSSPAPRTSGNAARTSASLSRTPASSSSSIWSRTAQAAAQATGLPPNVLAWSPGWNAPARCSQTTRQPIGSPFASPLASVSASGRTPDCSKQKKVPVRPTPVCTSSKTSSAPSSSASVLAACRNSGAAGRTPPSPCTGSSRIRPVSGRAAATSDSTSFSSAKETPGTSGSKAVRFSGWPVAESEPSVRPWKEPASATIPGRPVALRAYLIAASTASAPELQKNERPPPKRSDSFSASSSTSSVQYRFDVCQRRSSCARAAASGAGWQWPSPTTAMPATKSRYRSPLAATSQEPSPRTKVTSCRAYVGSSRSLPRSRLLGGALMLFAGTTGWGAARSCEHRRLADLRPDAEPRSRHRGAELRHDAALELASVQQPFRLAGGDGGGDGALQDQPGDVGQEEDPLGGEADGERRGRLVGVDVQRPGRQRRDDGDRAVLERRRDRRRPARQRVADQPELRHLPRAQPDLVPEQRQGARAERGAERGVHRGEGAADDREPLGGRHAAAVHELDGEPEPPHLLGDLRARAVHDDDARAALRQLEHPPRVRVADRAADLDDEQAHVR